MMATKGSDNEEFNRFDRLMGKLLKVPHSEIKAKLEAEKAEKEKRKVKPSASGRASRAKD